MRPLIAAVLAALVVSAGLAVPVAADPRIAVLEVKGMVCSA